VFGILHGLDADGASFLRFLVKRSPELRCRLILALYPACPTNSDSLHALLELQAEFAGRVEFHVLAGERYEERPANLLCILGTDGTVPVFVTGPTGNLGVHEPQTSQVNLCVRGDASLLDQFGNWFDYVWVSCPPLNEDIALIPALVPAKGDPAAERQWQEYLRACRNAREQVEEKEISSLEVNPETGAVTALDEKGELKQLPTATLEIPRLDQVSKKMTDILALGTLATIDHASRIPPFDCPIRAEWFGVQSLRQVGTVSRETKYRISVIDDKALKKLNSIRGKTRELLNRLSIPIAESARWLPDKARPLLEKEMDRCNKEGQDLLGETFGRDPGAFVDNLRDAIRRDAEVMYQEVNPGKALPDDVVDKIVEDLKGRLAKAAGGELLPKVSYMPLQGGVVVESKWASPWGQALLFLGALAEFPRKCCSDPYFMRGLKTTPEELLRALDVCEDGIVAAYFKDLRVDSRARAELALLEEVNAAEADDHAKCEAILAILRGDDRDQVIKLLTAAAQVQREDRASDSDEME